MHWQREKSMQQKTVVNKAIFYLSFSFRSAVAAAVWEQTITYLGKPFSSMASNGGMVDDFWPCSVIWRMSTSSSSIQDLFNPSHALGNYITPVLTIRLRINIKLFLMVANILFPRNKCANNNTSFQNQFNVGSLYALHWLHWNTFSYITYINYW